MRVKAGSFNEKKGPQKMSEREFSRTIASFKRNDLENYDIGSNCKTFLQF